MQAEPTRGLPQLHVHKVFVVIKKFGRLDPVQEGPGAVDPTGYHGNAGKSDALKSSKAGSNLIDDHSPVTRWGGGSGSPAGKQQQHADERTHVHLDQRRFQSAGAFHRSQTDLMGGAEGGGRGRRSGRRSKEKR